MVYSDNFLLTSLFFLAKIFMLLTKALDLL
mgnify:CR=1 FL=1